MLGREQMEPPPTSTKESVLLQQWTRSFSSGPSSQSHIEYSWGVFVGWLFFLLCPLAAFKAGGKHACNLEALKLDGGRVSHHSSIQLLPQNQVNPWEGCKVNGDLSWRESKQRKDCTEDYILSL